MESHVVQQPLGIAKERKSRKHKEALQNKKQIKRHHSKMSNMFTCANCLRMFTNKIRLTNHCLTHIKVFTCDKCSKSFNKKSNLQRHIFNIHNKLKNKFKCELCESTFSDQSNLIRHVKRHSVFPQRKSNFCTLCDQCGKQFKHHNSLAQHILHSHQPEISPNAKKLSVKHFQLHDGTHTCYTCVICYSTFNVSKLLSDHILNVHSVKSESGLFTCIVCLKTFLQKSYLKRHLTNYHFGSETYNCTVCPKKFDNKFEFEVHNESSHGLDLIKCDKCSRVFKNKKLLSMHIRRNAFCELKTNSRRVCAICKFVAKKWAMIEHYETAHDIEIVRESYTFNSMDAFLTWKNELEESEKSAYYLLSTYTKRGGESLRQLYHCHRDGNYVARGQNLRKTKLIGSHKINAFCPSELDVTYIVGESVVVHYVKTHVGHDFDENRLPCSIRKRKTEIKLEETEESHENCSTMNGDFQEVKERFADDFKGEEIIATVTDSYKDKIVIIKVDDGPENVEFFERKNQVTNEFLSLLNGAQSIQVLNNISAILPIISEAANIENGGLLE